MGLSFWHLIVILLVVLVVFGAGKLPHVMGDLGKGIRNFKSGLKDEAPSEEKPKIEKPDA
jgi:sec-independent protein translocase protein TatA